MIVLKKGKFISGSQIFRVGETLPDTAGARLLIKKNFAESIEEAPKKIAKNTKKSEPITIENAGKNP